MKEIRAICQDMPVVLSSLKDEWENVPEIAETGDTFVENATIKAEWVFSRKGVWTLADDSGLLVDAINGEPGVYSARYAGEEGNSAKNIEKLLFNLKDIPENKRTARFVCVMVLKRPNFKDVHAKGVCEGVIGFRNNGSGGFGYDPVFYPQGYNQTFAELNQEVKNRISHRGMALKVLKEELYGIFK